MQPYRRPKREPGSPRDPRNTVVPGNRLTIVVVCGDLGEFEAYRARRFAEKEDLTALFIYGAKPALLDELLPAHTKIVFTGTYYRSMLWEMHRNRDPRLRAFAVERRDLF